MTIHRPIDPETASEACEISVARARELLAQSRRLIEASRKAREMSERCRHRRRMDPVPAIHRAMIEF